MGREMTGICADNVRWYRWCLKICGSVKVPRIATLIMKIQTCSFPNLRRREQWFHSPGALFTGNARCT